MATFICVILTILLFAGSFGRVWCPLIIIAGIFIDVFLVLGYIAEGFQEREKKEKEEKDR